MFSIGSDREYFESSENRLNNQQILEKVSHKCYLPVNQILLKMLEKHPEFKVSFSISGVVLDQFAQYQPQVIDSFKRLIDTGRVELLAETYHHSLAFVFSASEFKKQVKLHQEKIKDIFGLKTQAFRNTELIFNNQVAQSAEALGFSTILAEGVDRYLGWRSPNYIYTPSETENIRLMLKNYKFSDDIAFRFSNQSWSEYPLTAEKFANWLTQTPGDVINIFMDYETFGEHQWAETGILQFLENLPTKIIATEKHDFMTISQASKKYKVVDEVNMPELTSWADVERDVSAWLGNPLQRNAARAVFDLEPAVYASNNPQIIEDWRRLTTSDHFYYMSTKRADDGSVHSYFSPNKSAYEAFTNYMNVLHDLRQRVYTE